MSLASYTFKRAVLTVATDADTTAAINISGFEVVGVGLPAALDGTTNDITFSVDPGDGTYREVNDDVGAPLILTNLVAGQIYQVQEGKPPIVGSELKLQLSETEAADRVFLVLLVALPN